MVLCHTKFTRFSIIPAFMPQRVHRQKSCLKPLKSPTLAVQPPIIPGQIVEFKFLAARCMVFVIFFTSAGQSYYLKRILKLVHKLLKGG